MQPKYVTDNNKAAKLFREDFYATAEMLEIGITEILADHANSKEADTELSITIKMVKRKMHELLFANGMAAFKGKRATTKAKQISQEMFEDFYGEMVELEKQPAEITKAPAAKKEAISKPTPKKEAEKPAPKKQSAVAPDFAAATA